jgi:hypothetical protein
VRVPALPAGMFMPNHHSLQTPLDVSELEALFGAQASAPAVQSAASSAPEPEKRRGPVLLLDGKREQQGLIMLAGLRTPDSVIRSAILSADSSGELWRSF